MNKQEFINEYVKRHKWGVILFILGFLLSPIKIGGWLLLFGSLMILTSGFQHISDSRKRITELKTKLNQKL
ncbi:hypothetical protein PQO03_11420 [Lentisphaera profundi]|uniref:Uncharacterized protein n=1 Tax=Lentisphaera profundi TaxID=1658616 RepID=A0ABY7VQ64_9BACT|nr:hypothetical protein [Lentisphaera profundi]WDE96318.1 hypothetical protein PQO03_11420 [Lentisphaera profundi]